MDNLFKAAQTVYKCDPMAKGRRREFVWARRALFVYLNKYESLAKIGKRFDLDHASVLFSLRRHDELYGVDREYTETYNEFCDEAGLPIKKIMPERKSPTPRADRNPTLIKLVQEVPEEYEEIVYIRLKAIIHMIKSPHKLK